MESDPSKTVTRVMKEVLNSDFRSSIIPNHENQLTLLSAGQTWLLA